MHLRNDALTQRQGSLVKTVSKLLVAASLCFVSVTGCSDASKEIEKFADRACACKDAACAEKVAEDFGAWAKKNKDASGDADKAAKSAEKMAKCMIEKGMDPSKLSQMMMAL